MSASARAFFDSLLVAYRVKHAVRGWLDLVSCALITFRSVFYGLTRRCSNVIILDVRSSREAR